MPSPADVPRRLVLRMLAVCAPGFTTRLTTHRFQVRWNGRVFRLPKGAHGDRQARVDPRRVLTMARYFDIEQCARREIPQL